MEAWIETSKSHDIDTIQDKRNGEGGAKDSGYHFFLINGMLGVQVIAGNHVETLISERFLADGVFHHVGAAFQRNATHGIRLFADGALVKTADSNPIGQSDLNNDTEFRIGAHSFETVLNFDGLIDEFSFYKKALSDDDMLAIFEAGAAGKCKASNPTPLTSLGDVNGDNTPEIAVVTHNVATQTTVARVKDAKTGLLVKRMSFNGRFAPRTASVVNDLNSNGAPEIALLGVRDTDNAVLVEVRDSQTGVRIHSTRFPATFTPKDLAIIPNVNGQNTAGLAVLQQNNSTLRVQLKDAATGAEIRRIRFGNRYDGVNLQVLSDLNGNGKPELAVLGHNKTATRADSIEIRDSSTGDFIRRINFGKGSTPQQLFVLPDLNTSGGQELAVLRTTEGRVEVKDSQTGLPVKILNYGLQPYRLASVSDSSGSTDLAMLGTRALDGQIRAGVREVLTDWPVKRIIYDQRGDSVGFVSIPDINDNGVSELVRLRQESGRREVVAEVRDGKTGELLKAFGF